VELNDYQQRAQDTDRVKAGMGDTGLMVPFLGLAGEAGELLSEYKKHLRDGYAHILFPERVTEELGDILWYVANIATKFGIPLETIATQNLSKTRDRWSGQSNMPLPFDESSLEGERFPRRFVVDLREIQVDGQKKIRPYMDGEPMGDDLTDNAYYPDGYRFHDVFHLGYVAVLGWSPVVRKLLGKKRRSDPRKDEVEDGGRAGVIDEAIAALVFDYARKHNWLEGVEHLDYQLLKTIKGITAHLDDVNTRTQKDWQDAILAGYRVWRHAQAANGGRIEVDMTARDLRYLGPSDTAAEPSLTTDAQAR